MARRMTRAQRAERDGWLEVARQFETGTSRFMGLCLHAVMIDAALPADTATARLQRFNPLDGIFWWPTHDDTPDYTRSLVACFLAAMAESGD